MVKMNASERKTYLTFQLGDEMFAVDVRYVHEVLEFKGASRIPGVSDYVRGIINLRGTVVPVIDLGLKFGMGQVAERTGTCVIVMEIGSGDKKIVMGALVGLVHEVVEFETGQIEPPPRIGRLSQKDFICGIGKREDQFIILLNINRVCSSDEVILLGASEEDEIIEEESGKGLEEEKAEDVLE